MKLSACLKMYISSQDRMLIIHWIYYMRQNILTTIKITVFNNCLLNAILNIGKKYKLGWSSVIMLTEGQANLTICK